MDEWINARTQHVLPNFFPPANLSRSPDEIYQRLLQKSLRVTATARRRARGVPTSFSSTFGYFNWPRVSEQISQDAVSVWFTGSGFASTAQRGKNKRALRSSALVSGSWYRSLKWRLEGISESCAPIRTRGDSAIKMEQRGGRDLSRPFMRGGGKKWRGRRGKVVKKREERGGIPFFFFFFFRVTVGHVQNLNHPPRPAIRFISGEVSRGFRAAS